MFLLLLLLLLLHAATIVAVAAIADTCCCFIMLPRMLRSICVYMQINWRQQLKIVDQFYSPLIYIHTYIHTFVYAYIYFIYFLVIFHLWWWWKLWKREIVLHFLQQIHNYLSCCSFFSTITHTRTCMLIAEREGFLKLRTKLKKEIKLADDNPDLRELFKE